MNDNNFDLWGEDVFEKKAPEPEAEQSKSTTAAGGGPFGFVSGWPIPFDIETGPLEEAELRATFKEKTEAEFAASCDKRWKADTVAAKYAEYKTTAWAELVERAALSPITGRVLAIGYGQRGKTTIGIGGNAGEATILDEFWAVFAWASTTQPPTRLIGFNSNSFDVPFMVRRSWKLGVEIPFDLFLGRYLHPLFVDLMETWQCGDRQARVSLDKLSTYLGGPAKPDGIGGGDFHKLFFGTKKQRQQAVAYLENDIAMTAFVANRLGY